MSSNLVIRTARVLLMGSVITHGIVERCSGLDLNSPLPPSPARSLLNHLDRARRASTLEERRSEIPAAMRALLNASPDVLLNAMSEVLREGEFYDEMRRMLVEQCAVRQPEEAIGRLNGLAANESARAEASWQVWAVIARTNPERALEAALAFFDPKHAYYRSQLHHGGVGRPVSFIAKAVGESWWKRDGMATLKKLGSLPHADKIDGDLLEGMCAAATSADECLALLEWFVGPGRYVDRFEKGFDVWWERPMKVAASLDRGKAKAWIERTFPPGVRRVSSKVGNMDGLDFRRVFFHHWAKTSPSAAADWYAAQFGDDDEEGDAAVISCVNALSGENGDMSAALRWLMRFHGKPRFSRLAASVLNSAGSLLRDDTRLKQVTAWLTVLPEDEREGIIMKSRRGFEGYDVPFTASLDNKILRWTFPEETVRKAVLARLRKNLKPDEFTEQIDEAEHSLGNEFLLPDRTRTIESSPAAIAMAQKLAAQHAAATTSRDPRERLAGTAAFDWLAMAPSDKLREMLQAHLEDPSVTVMPPDDISPFAEAVIEAWVIHHWRACEQFAWECSMHGSVRRALLIETFKKAASRHPDEVFDRLEELAKEGRFWPDSLLRDGSDIQWGSNCCMGYVPQFAGAAWIKRDGEKAVERFKSLPESWRRGVITGAANHFTNARSGLALLNWLEELDSAVPAGKEDDRWPLLHPLEIKDALRRLAQMNLESAKQWIEAKPERHAQSKERFDNFHLVQSEMYDRDPVAATLWSQKMRPGEGTTWMLIQALLAQEERLAVEWVAAHADDPHIESAYLAMAEHWRTDHPERAAEMISKMKKGERRTREAAYLFQSWSRLDATAAKRFLDDVAGVETEERQEIEKEIARLEKYAFDRRK